MNDICKDLIQDFLLHLGKERNLSHNTISAYGRDLDRFFNFLVNYDSTLVNNLNRIDRHVIRHFLGSEFERKDIRPGRNGKNITARTIARELATIKSFFKYLVLVERINNNPAINVQTPKIEKQIPNFVQLNKIQELMEQPKKEKRVLIRKRDYAILELFYATGIRLSELVGLNIGSVNHEENLLKVIGKGNKERIVPFGRKAKTAIEQYLNERGDGWGSQSDLPLFMGTKKKRISNRTVQSRLKKYLQIILGGKKGASPHTLRHTFGTHLLDNDADIRSIQELLGHNSISSTQIYTKVNPEKMKKIYESAHPHAS